MTRNNCTWNTDIVIIATKEEKHIDKTPKKKSYNFNDMKFLY